MAGDHNILNLLAAICVARYLGMTEEEIRNGVTEFKGVNRRFTLLGKMNGVSVVDDYAHHPTEIRAVLKAAKQTTEGRVVAIHQPHRFSRLANLFEEFTDCFEDADVVGITPIFAAGEHPIKGITSNKLISKISKRHGKVVKKIENEMELEGFIEKNSEPNDLIIFMGAGSISTWANNMMERIIK